MRDVAMFLAGGFTFLGLAALAFAIAGRVFFPSGALFGAADCADPTADPEEPIERARQTRILSAEEVARHAPL